MHALAEYGLMHVKLYEDITRFGACRDQLRLSGDGERAGISMVAEPDPGLRQSEDGPDAGAAAVRRRAGEADLCRPALYARWRASISTTIRSRHHAGAALRGSAARDSSTSTRS
jgi:hypothetical protein